MHFDFLIEDKSGKIMLEHLIPKIIDIQEHSFKVKPYEGIGRLPKNLATPKEIRHQALLNDLPRALKAYGKTHKGYGVDYPVCLFVICDLDARCQRKFREELSRILNQCSSPPRTQFCIAVEEGEAWLLGDVEAIMNAYPKAKSSIIKGYINDSICGTWEVLEKALGTKNKSEWAKNITPYMQVENNKSPSFQYFVSKVRDYSNE